MSHAAGAIAGGIMMLAIGLGGCSTDSTSIASASADQPATSASPSIGNRIGTLFGSDSPSSAGTTGSRPPATEIDCPIVDIRTGAATLMFNRMPADGEPSALDLKYQGTIVRAARECAVNADTVSMKIGVEGRIINGPAGGAGQLQVPLRIAVVHEGPNPKTVVSKLHVIPVTITEGNAHTSFTKVDSEIAFPMPKPAGLIDQYVIYIGFDPAGAVQQDQKKRPAKQRRRN